MRFIRKSVMEARRAEAARRASAAPAQASAELVVVVEAPAADIPDACKPGATGQAKAKKQPKGDYEVGYARPPVHTRFDGSKAGPGRPKGSLNQDTIVRRRLNTTRSIRADGRERKVTHRELALMILEKKAFEDKDRHALIYLLGEAARLHPSDDGEVRAGVARDLSADDQQVLDLMLGQFGVAFPPKDDGNNGGEGGCA